jgi:hypothetical protein
VQLDDVEAVLLGYLREQLIRFELDPLKDVVP